MDQKLRARRWTRKPCPGLPDPRGHEMADARSGLRTGDRGGIPRGGAVLPSLKGNYKACNQPIQTTTNSSGLQRCGVIKMDRKWYPVFRTRNEPKWLPCADAACHKIQGTVASSSSTARSASQRAVSTYSPPTPLEDLHILDVVALEGPQHKAAATSGLPGAGRLAEASTKSQAGHTGVFAIAGAPLACHKSTSAHYRPAALDRTAVVAATPNRRSLPKQRGNPCGDCDYS
jgi:hypothetical protein